MADQENFPDIYIDESVASGGVGSLADPYSDFSEINWTTGGDNSIYDYYNNSPTTSVTINLKKGEEWLETLTIGGSGTATYPIIIRSYGSGANPIINGADLCNGTWTDAGSNRWYHTWSTDYYQVFFDGARGSEELTLEAVDAEHDWYYDSGNSRLYVWCDNGSGPNAEYTSPGVEATIRHICINADNDDYIDVTELDMHYSNFGINLQSGSNNCNVYDNDFSYISKRAIYTPNSDNLKIYDNTFSYCGVHMATGEHAVYLSTSDNVEIYGNEISYSWDCGIKVDGCNDIKIYQNYIHDNGVSGDYWGEILITTNAGSVSNIEVYYNIFTAGGGYAIQTNKPGVDAISNVSIYNNTFYDNNPGSGPKTYVLRFEDVDTLNIKNNIIRTGREYIFYYLDNTSLSRDYNCYYGWTHATNIGYIDVGYVTWAQVNAVETNSINSDPLFVSAGSDHHLQSGSPCIDTGVDVNLTEDYEDNIVPYNSIPDMGAYEKQRARSKFFMIKG